MPARALVLNNIRIVTEGHLFRREIEEETRIGYETNIAAIHSPCFPQFARLTQSTNP